MINYEHNESNALYAKYLGSKGTTKHKRYHERQVCLNTVATKTRSDIKTQQVDM